MFKNISNSFQVIQRNVVTDIFVGSKKYRSAFFRLELQRSNPGVQVFSRKLALKMLQAGLPIVLGHLEKRFGKTSGLVVVMY